MVIGLKRFFNIFHSSYLHYCLGKMSCPSMMNVWQTMVFCAFMAMLLRKIIKKL